MLQLVEAPTKVLVTLLRNLAEVSQTSGSKAGGKGATSFLPGAATNQAPLLRTSKVLSFTEEVPREFHIWAWRALRMPADDFMNSTLGLNLQRDSLKVLFETVKNLLELGRELSGMSEEKAIDFIQTSVSRQFTSKLPTSERLQAYIHSIEDLCSIQEWLDIFDTPIEFTLENEKVWPVEPFLKY
jgi:hypothetical protein